MDNIGNVSCGNWADCEIALEILHQKQLALTIVIEQANTDLLVWRDEIDVSTTPVSALLAPPIGMLTERIASHLRWSGIPRSFKRVSSQPIVR